MLVILILKKMLMLLTTHWLEGTIHGRHLLFLVFILIAHTHQCSCSCGEHALACILHLYQQPHSVLYLEWMCFQSLSYLQAKHELHHDFWAILPFYFVTKLHLPLLSHVTNDCVQVDILLPMWRSILGICFTVLALHCRMVRCWLTDGSILSGQRKWLRFDQAKVHKMVPNMLLVNSFS